MQRSRARFVAWLVVPVMVVMSLAMPASIRALQDDDADDGSIARYRSPNYGYALTYDANVWAIVIEDSNPYDRFDRAFWSNESSLLSVTSHPDYKASNLSDCVTGFELGLWNTPEVTDRAVLDEPGAAGMDDIRAWQTIEFAYEDEDGEEVRNIGYIECLWLGDALAIAIRHDAPAAVYEREAEARESFLDGLAPPDGTRAGQYLFAAEANRHRNDQPDVSPEVYESPTYGYEIAYDPVAWRVSGGDDAPEDEYDRVVFANVPSEIFIWGDPDYDADEMADCVEDYAGSVTDADGVTAIEPLDDREASGEDDARAWTTFSYVWEYRPGAAPTFIQYVECVWIGDGVTLAIIHEASEVSYYPEIALREAFLAPIPARSD